MTTDREEFAEWLFPQEEMSLCRQKDMWCAWQAATAKQAEKIALLREALKRIQGYLPSKSTHPLDIKLTAAVDEALEKTK